MSSFICTAKHFNSVEKGLQSLIIWDPNFYCYKLKKRFPALSRHNAAGVDQQEETIGAIVDDLRRLSVLCVSLQYAHNHTGTLDKEIQTETDSLLNDKRDFVVLSLHGLYNALRCIHYQIEAEHLKELRALTQDEENAMFFLSTMIDELAHILIRAMPEDLTCKWSID